MAKTNWPILNPLNLSISKFFLIYIKVTLIFLLKYINIYKEINNNNIFVYSYNVFLFTSTFLISIYIILYIVYTINFHSSQ